MKATVAERQTRFMKRVQQQRYVLGESTRYALTVASASFLSFHISLPDATDGEVGVYRCSRAFFRNHLYNLNSEDVK